MQDSDSFVARSHILTGQYIAEVAEALLFSCRRKIYGMQTSSTKAYGLIDSAFRKIDSSLRLRAKGFRQGETLPYFAERYGEEPEATHFPGNGFRGNRDCGVF